MLLAIGLVLVFAGIAVVIYPTGIACGDYFWGIVPVPYAVVAGCLMLAGSVIVLLSRVLVIRAIKAIAQRLLVSIISLVVSLVLLDIGLRLTEPPFVYPEPFYINHDRLSYFFAPNASHRFLLPNMQYARFESDDQGFIIRDGSNQPDPDAHRILFLGDSFLEGAQVRPEENLSVVAINQLEERTGENYQGLNVGVSGYSLVHYLLAYREFSEAFNPEIVVIIAYVGNDFWDTIRLVQGDRLIVDDQGNLAGIEPGIAEGYVVADFSRGPIPLEEVRATIIPRDKWRAGLFRTLQWILVRPACERRELAQEWEAQLEAFADDLSHEQQAGVESCRFCQAQANIPVSDSFDAIFKPVYTDEDIRQLNFGIGYLSELVDEIKSDGRRVLIVIMPVNNQVPNQGNGTKPAHGLGPDEVIASRGPQDLLVELCVSNDLDCLDLLPIFIDHQNELLYWRNETHLATRGHELTGELIAEYINQQFP